MTTDQFHEHVITRLDRIEALLQPSKSKDESAARRQQRLRESKKAQTASTINATSVSTSPVNS